MAKIHKKIAVFTLKNKQTREHNNYTSKVEMETKPFLKTIPLSVIQIIYTNNNKHNSQSGTRSYHPQLQKHTYRQLRPTYKSINTMVVSTRRTATSPGIRKTPTTMSSLPHLVKSSVAQQQPSISCHLQRPFRPNENLVNGYIFRGEIPQKDSLPSFF